jgi:hypothetical protein
MQKNFVRYKTEGLFGDIITITISKEEAIERQIKSGEINNYIYNSREEALEDFMACNWAWFFEETPY